MNFDALNSSPLNGSATVPTVSGALTLALLLGGAVIEQDPSVSDAVVMSSTPVYDYITILRDGLSLVDGLASGAHFGITAADVARFSDQVRLLYDLFAAESLSLDDLVAGDPRRVADLIDTLLATDVVSARHEAIALVAVAMALQDAAAPVFALDAADAVTLTPAAAARARVIAATLSELMMTADIAGTRAALALSSSALSLLAAIAAGQQITATADSEVQFDVGLVINGELYTGWVFNAETMAPSEYTRYSFDSMCALMGCSYGVNADGLYRLDGDDDAGEPIEARIVTGELDFGASEIKRLEEAFIGYTATGDLVLKVTTTHAGQRMEHWYMAPNPVPGAPTETRVVPGKGLASRYWQFELVNVEGADFEIDQILFTPIRLSRRL